MNMNKYHNEPIKQEGGQTMKKYIFTASRDAIDIDYSIIWYAKEEPNYWKQCDLAEKHGCYYFTLEELND